MKRGSRMKEKDEYRLLVFNSTHHALEAEDLLKEEGYNIMMVPIPPAITADCGIAVRLSENVEEGLELLVEANIKLAGYYEVVEQGLEKRIRRLKI